MTRPITPAMANVLAAGAPLVVFVKIDHPDGTGYFCTGVIKRTWDGQTWTAAGTLGGVAPVQRSGDISIQDITFSLSGVDVSLLAQLNDDVRNRRAEAWLACLDNNGNVIADPYKLIDAEMDVQIFSTQDDGTAKIEITAHAGFYTLDRGVDEAWTPENQQQLYPGDTGMDMIPSLIHQDLQWAAT